MRKELQSEPAQYEVGRFYRVPCVWASWPDTHLTPRWWPVLGPQHEDSEFLNAPFQHYHVDFRFLERESREVALTPQGPPRAFSVVITAMNIIVGKVGPYGKVKRLAEAPSAERLVEDAAWFRVRRMKCKAPWSAYPHKLAFWREALERAYQGQRLRNGRFCPHKGADLGTFTPDGDVVTCPLHGLRWNIRTGELTPTTTAMRMPTTEESCA